MVKGQGHSTQLSKKLVDTFNALLFDLGHLYLAYRLSINRGSKDPIDFKVTLSKKVTGRT